MVHRAGEEEPGVAAVDTEPQAPGHQVVKRDDAIQGLRHVLMHLGMNPYEDGLRGTPDRILRWLDEATAGYDQSPQEILSTTFEAKHDEMVLLKRIEFVSTCEHHLLPFVGTATVGYIPAQLGGVVGLSKLARVVDCFARRFQLQERMTDEIAMAIWKHLQPVGVGVILRAHHSCMGCRGVRKPGSEMVTSSMLGALREDARARSEFLSLAAE